MIDIELEADTEMTVTAMPDAGAVLSFCKYGRCTGSCAS